MRDGRVAPGAGGAAARKGSAPAGFWRGGAGHASHVVAHTLELTLPPEPDSVARARTQVCDALTADMDEETVETVRLLISEVVTNAVRHGAHDQPVELKAHWNSEVRIAVCDHGDGFIPH